MKKNKGDGRGGKAPSTFFKKSFTPLQSNGRLWYNMCRSPAKGERQQRQGKDKTMIAMTNKNGKYVRLTANFQLDVEKVTYEVYCNGVAFEFSEFSTAARVYKILSRRIEGETLTVPCLMNLVSGARAMGYKVTGA